MSTIQLSSTNVIALELGHHCKDDVNSVVKKYSFILFVIFNEFLKFSPLKNFLSKISQKMLETAN